MSLTVPCTNTCNHSTFDEKRRSRKHFRQVSFKTGKLEQSLVSRNKIFQSENSLRKFLSFSHLSLSLVLGFSEKTQQCTCSHDKQSASLYTRQDSIDMSAFKHKTHAHCIQMLQSHMLSPSAWTSVQRREETHCMQCVQSTRTRKEGENAHGVGREEHYEHSGRQHDHQDHEHQSPHQP